MKSGAGREHSEMTSSLDRVPEPKFLVELEPWHRNLAGLLKRQPNAPLPSPSSPGEFWPDVFVASGLPWRRFLDSTVYHLLLVAAFWGSYQLGFGRPHLVAPSTFNRADVIYYPESEYLPPLNSPRHISYLPKKGEPEFARQDIISVPANPDNSQQTIVTAPQVKLDHDVPMPNIVAWSPTKVEVPLAATERSAAEMTLPELPTSVVAPPPDVRADARLRAMDAPDSGVIKPPPSVQQAALRSLGDVDIGHSEVVGPAPKLPMAEQHRAGGLGNSPLTSATAVVPPPPSIGGSGGPRGGGQLIALSVHPAPAATAQAPSGNRRGTFAATPRGKAGAPGTPEAASGSDSGESGSSARAGNGPAGIYVGPGSNGSAVTGDHANAGSDGPADSRLSASATPPRVTSAPREVSPDKATEEEKKVFGDRKVYSMSLNVPNLNSAGGSWVIHFAELKDDAPKGDLSAPVAVKEVDPAYPTELMRQNVAGRVTLKAVIHSDGSVDTVQVLSSADDRLNPYARAALTRWQFRPATRNGTPVDLQAVIVIPFRPSRWRNSF